jgi:hypothetical protein
MRERHSWHIAARLSTDPHQRERLWRRWDDLGRDLKNIRAAIEHLPVARRGKRGPTARMRAWPEFHWASPRPPVAPHWPYELVWNPCQHHTVPSLLHDRWKGVWGV